MIPGLLYAVNQVEGKYDKESYRPFTFYIYSYKTIWPKRASRFREISVFWFFFVIISMSFNFKITFKVIWNKFGDCL